MNVFLIVLAASGVRFISWEPQYVIQYPTEQACIQAAAKLKDQNKKGICIPEVKLK